MRSLPVALSRSLPKARRLDRRSGAHHAWPVRQSLHRLSLTTRGRGLHDISAEIEAWVRGQGIAEGLLTIFIQHTSASLTIQENADPDVLRDLDDFFSALVPDDVGRYRHVSEGADDMPAHIRAALTQSQLAVPVSGGRLSLGTWQGIYLFEHRTRPRTRHLALHLLGE